jgi:hypothetical protein
MPHSLALAISSNDYLDILWKIFRQPERNIAFTVSIPVSEVIDSFKHQYNFFVYDFGIIDDLVLDGIIAHLQPVREVFA